MTLVLISDFMQDEIYLNEEVKYYDKLDRTIFFTVRGHVYSNKHLDLPDYVEVGKLDIFYKSILERIKYLVIALFRKETLKDIKYLFASKKFSINSLKRLILFSAKSELVYEYIYKSLEKKGLDKEEPIVFYTYRVGFSSLASCRLKRIYKNSKVVSRCHAQDIFEFRNKENYLPFRKYLYENIDRFYCISEDGKNYLNSSYKKLSAKTHLYRLGTREININDKINNKNFVILTCSRIARIKRLELIAKALKSIKNENIRWIHYGDGDSEYLKEIEEIIKDCGDNIKIDFRGFCENEEYLEIISKEELSVFVNVSESEGLPVSIMEAESVGLPIIATDVGGTSEAVIDGYNGILLDKDINYKEIADAIMKFKEIDEKEFDKLRENSRKIWENKFRLSSNYSKFVDNIKEL